MGITRWFLVPRRIQVVGKILMLFHYTRFKRISAISIDANTIPRGIGLNQKKIEKRRAHI
jgi:hypothetical protein